MSERINLARLKKQGLVFELDIDPDLAIEYKKTGKGTLAEVLRSPHIYRDAKKGLIASAEEKEKVFAMRDETAIAEQILKEGEIQVTEHYRQEMREQKKRRILTYLQRNAVNPKTDKPHPLTLLEAAFEEAKIHVDEHTSEAELMKESLKKMKVILPLKIEVKEIEIHIPSTYAHQCYGILKSFGTIMRDQWMGDQSRLVSLEIPGGVEQDMYDKLNSLTHGGITAKILKTRS